MGNAPVIIISASKTLPEYRERYYQWVYEVYYPRRLQNPLLKGIDAYRIVKENVDYNPSFSIHQFGSLNDLENAYNSQEWVSTSRDRDTTFQQTGRSERFWSAAYQLMRNFTNPSGDSQTNKGQGTDDARIIHLEGYRLAPEEEERYDTWFTKWGYEVYIPLLMKLPGLRGHAQYKHTLVNIPDTDRKTKNFVEYPPYLSILTFDNLEAYKNYENSLELAALKGALRAPFPRGLEYRWWVQYRLIKSWRK